MKTTKVINILNFKESEINLEFLRWLANYGNPVYHDQSEHGEHIYSIISLGEKIENIVFDENSEPNIYKVTYEYLQIEKICKLHDCFYFQIRN